MNKLWIAITLLAMSAVPAMAEDTWVQVRCPHFIVISNGGEKQARDVAVGFEQMHNLFAVGLPGLRTDPGAQNIVLAVKDEKTLKSILPANSKMVTAAYFFLRGKDTQYAVLRLDATREGNYEIYREYVQELLSFNFRRMPTWLYQGLAEYYSNSRFEKDHTLVGVPSSRVSLLQHSTLIPVAKLLTATPDFSSQRDADMYYAESWAFTHFLLSADEMQNGTLINAYLRALQQGADSAEAFQQTFGEPSQLQQKFEAYVHQNTFRVLALNPPVNIDESAFSAKRLSPAEIDAILGGFESHIRQSKTAREMLTAALSQDPKTAMGYENLAMLDFWEGHDAEAKREFDQAVALDGTLYLSLYYRTMMELNGKTDEESLTKMEQSLRTVLQFNPRFALAWAGLSKVYVRRGDFPHALQAAIEAKNSAPDRVGFLTNVAAVLLLGKDYANAIKTGSLAASLADASDADEALAVVNEARRLGHIPAAPEEKAQEEKEMRYAQRTIAVEGVVKSVSCQPSKSTSLVLNSSGKDLLFQNAKDSSAGLSDTFWFAGDYANLCNRLAGVQALIRYKVPSDLNPDDSIHLLNSSDPTDIVYVEYRDELIPSSDPTPAN